MSSASFACVINCMDGRTQEPVMNYLRDKLAVEYVDAVTEPGPIAHLAANAPIWVDNIKACCDVSVYKHNAVAIAVVGHHDCAGNPVPKETQLEQMRLATKTIRDWYPQLPIYGLWVNDCWTVEEMITDFP